MIGVSEVGGDGGEIVVGSGAQRQRDLLEPDPATDPLRTVPEGLGECPLDGAFAAMEALGEGGAGLAVNARPQLLEDIVGEQARVRRWALDHPLGDGAVSRTRSIARRCDSRDLLHERVQPRVQLRRQRYGTVRQ
ncbi:MAG: hypothetical protein QM650_12355 [Microlunatus sp.]